MTDLSENIKANMAGTSVGTEFTGEKTGGKFLAVVISMVNDSTSTVAARKVIKSIHDTDSELNAVILPATTPATLDKDLADFDLTKSNWTYPIKPGETKLDISTGLNLTGYNANDLNKVISCMVSHMRIWQLSAGGNLPIVVLEHDALFTRKFVASDFPKLGGGIIGLNDPRGATRKSAVYYDKVISAPALSKEYPHIKEAPYVDDDKLAPQGIAGNSAYIIYPRAAGHMLNLVKEYGLWPNDALMCKQLVPYLKHVHPFYTKLQGVASTTQG